MSDFQTLIRIKSIPQKVRVKSASLSYQIDLGRQPHVSFINNKYSAEHPPSEFS